MYVLVWCECDYDEHGFEVLSYSEDEQLLYEVKRLFDDVEKIEGWRLKKEYIKSLSKDVDFDIHPNGYLDVLKVGKYKDFKTTNLDKFFKDVSLGVISEKILEDAEKSEFKKQQLTKKLKASFADQVQWKLHYDLGYPATRVSSVKGRIEDMFESNQGDIEKSVQEVVEYFERFGKE